MQAKMIKPQMVQLGISFVYLIVWFLVLTPYFGVTSLVYLPGIGPVPVVYWYPICSFFLRRAWITPTRHTANRTLRGKVAMPNE